MRFFRLTDLAAIVGVVCLLAAIGEGRHESAKARARRDPLLWQLQVYDMGGRLLRSSEVIGSENQPLALRDPLSERPRLELSLLPRGLPDGALDVQLHFSVDGTLTSEAAGFRVSPGETVRLDVPGHPFKLALRAVRLGKSRGPPVS